MQNEHSHTGGFRKFLREKGYYIVLSLCILAVGVAGVLLVTGALSEQDALEQPTLSVATQADIPQKPQTTPAVNKPDITTAEPAAREEIPSVEASAEQAVRDTAASIRIWPVSGETVADYSVDALSYNVTTRDWRTHEGVDLSASVGEPVKAACAGTVTAVYDDEYLGTTVVITHPEGYATHYANLAAMPTVSVGQTVTVGQIIGSVGETALLEAGEASHLHFAVYCFGEYTDPAEFVE